VNALAAGRSCDPLAQPIGLLLRGSPVFKRRVRNVRRLQLVCLNLFYEHIQLDMHRHDSNPRRNQCSPMEAILGAFEQFQELKG
jgi:hypothetical protein